MMFGKTRKGRGYYKYDAPSHGSPHKLNDEQFWHCRQDFSDNYGVKWHGTGEPAPKDEGRPAPAVRRQPERGPGRAAQRRGAADLPGRPPGRTGRERARGDQGLPPAGQGQNPLHDPMLFDFEQYPAGHVGQARRQAAQPRRLRQVGQLDQQLLPQEVRPSAVPGLLGRPGRLDQHLGLRRRLRRPAQHRLVQPRQEPRRGDPAPGHHRVRQRRPHGRRGLGELRRPIRRRSSTASSPPAAPTARSAT